MNPIRPLALALSASLVAQQAVSDIAVPAAPPATPRLAGPAQAGQLPPDVDASLRPTLVRSSQPMRLPETVLFDRPTTGVLWAQGHDWKACFDGRGTTFIPFFGSEAPKNFPLRIELASVSVGGQPLELVDGKPQVDRGVVRIVRGAITETIATELASIEQSLVFERLPNRGAVHVDIAFRGELAASALTDGLQLRNELGAVEYRKAVAVDADGARLPLAIEWDGDSAHITIPAEFVANARLPLVLDPIINTRTSLASGQTQLQRDPDVATLQAPDRSIVVWRRQWSLTDWDCYAQVLDANLANVGGLAVLDFTSTNWIDPKVASSLEARNFMVVAQLEPPGAFAEISARTVTETGTTSSLIVIERDGFGSSFSGPKLRPDIGGDPFPFNSSYCVVWESQTIVGNHDIYFRRVSPTGTLLGSSATLLSSGSQNETFPCISKSTNAADWYVVWQRTSASPPFHENLWAARITFGGGIMAGPIPVATTVDDETRPSISSPVEVAGGDARVLLAYEISAGGQRDIVCTVLSRSLSTLANLNLSQAEFGGAFATRDQSFPEVDSDNKRFLVGYSEWDGSESDVYVTTIAYPPGATVPRIDESRAPLATLGNYGYSRIASYYSGGRQPSSRFIVGGIGYGANDPIVWDHGGYQPGPFFSTFPTQCGALGITASGSSVIGETATFTVNTALPSGTIFGTVGYQSLAALGCNCFLGVDGPIFAPNPLSIAIPSDVMLVGLVFSVQGYGFSGANCFGFLDLSDTIDMTIR